MLSFFEARKSTSYPPVHVHLLHADLAIMDHGNTVEKEKKRKGKKILLERKDGTGKINPGLKGVTELKVVRKVVKGGFGLQVLLKVRSLAACSFECHRICQSSRKEKKKKKTLSRGWFRSIDLWVMGPARSRCATLLLVTTGNPTTGQLDASRAVKKKKLKKVSVKQKRSPQAACIIITFSFFRPRETRKLTIFKRQTKKLRTTRSERTSFLF